jgi:predicted porin
MRVLFFILLAFVGIRTTAAQSNVTVYGIIDIGFSAIKTDNSGTHVIEDSSIQQGSRLGLKGSEDLGSGYSVEFRLESGFNGDTGTLGQGGRLFGRQAYVGLNGNFGSLKLGRQWIPSYVVLNDLDPFGVALAGDASRYFGFNIYDNDIRMDNAVNYSYEKNNFSVVATVGLGEQARSSSAGRQQGIAISQEAGPLNLQLGYHKINNVDDSGEAKSLVIGAIYNWGVLKTNFAWGADSTSTGAATTYDKRNYLIGATAPIKSGTLIASAILQSDRLSQTRNKQYALGYSHTLSKRSNLYASIGYADISAITTIDFGIRHVF